MCYASSVGESFLDYNAFSRSILFFLHLGNPLFPSLSISWNQCHQDRPYIFCSFYLKCRGDPGGRPLELARSFCRLSGCRDLHIINEEGRCHTEATGRLGTENQCHRFTGMTGEQGSCAKVGLFPALSSVSVASMLQLTDDFTIAIQYRHRKRIATLMRGTRGISVPPVIDCEPGNAMRNGEVLRQCIITTTVATEVGTVLSRVWVGRVNQLIAVGR